MSTLTTATPREEAANESSLGPQTFPLDSHPRLSMATSARVTLGSAAASLIGFSLGATQGGQMAQLRFRAEHAHKMPDSTTGWYLYHKTKNYHAMQGGIREGLRMGARTGFWSFMALSLESTVDRCRGASDMFSTIIASLSVAGAFSLWRKFMTPALPNLPTPRHQICPGTLIFLDLWRLFIEGVIYFVLGIVMIGLSFVNVGTG